MTPHIESAPAPFHPLAQLGELATHAIAIVTTLAEAQRSMASYELAGSLDCALRRIDVLLSALRHGGVVVSQRGRSGGYSLASPPQELTLLAIVEATRLVGADRPPKVRRMPEPPHVLDVVDDVVRQWLANTSVADVITRRAVATS